MDGAGVDNTTLGSTVVTVADADEKNESTSAGDSTGAVALFKGKKPTIGGSFVLIPKLQGRVERYAQEKPRNLTYLNIE